jgi:hypothetical protein
MRVIIGLMVFVFSVSIAEAQKKYDKVHYGNEIEADGALSLDELMEDVEEADEKLPMETKLKGKVQAVCQKKGCWMKMKRPNGQAMRVTFKDYGFFVPKDLAGNAVAMKGRLYQDTVSAKVRRHYARDEGKSEEEVEQITEPATRLAFKAYGVKILQDD